MAQVVSIVYTPADVEQRPQGRYARVPVVHATLVEGRGIKGDTKARRGKRQLNVMLAETVEQLRAEGFQTASGELGEQLVIAGLAPDSVASGTQLGIGGSAVLEVTYPRTPCGRFARVQGRAKGDASGRLGFMAKVLQGGEVVVGSHVRLLRANVPPVSCER